MWPLWLSAVLITAVAILILIKETPIFGSSVGRMRRAQIAMVYHIEPNYVREAATVPPKLPERQASCFLGSAGAFEGSSLEIAVCAMIHRENRMSPSGFPSARASDGRTLFLDLIHVWHEICASN
jgi:hypothetical protein